MPPSSRVAEEAVRSEIRRQLHDAWKRSEMTLAALLEKSGLALDEPGLSRKLSGEYALRTFEAEAIADALKERIAYGRKRRAS